MKRQYLTTRQKDNLKPFFLKKQDNKCLFCRDAFLSTPANDEMKTTFEHLDNNPFNNEKENLALVHKKCNKDKQENPDYQIIAQDQLKENHNSFDSLGVGIDRTPKPTTKEMDINVITWKLVKDFINERILIQNKPALDLNDTSHSIAYLLKEQTGHGSDQTVKRHILDYCSEVAPFKCEEENGKWIIRKRGN